MNGPKPLRDYLTREQIAKLPTDPIPPFDPSPSRYVMGYSGDPNVVETPEEAKRTNQFNGRAKKACDEWEAEYERAKAAGQPTASRQTK